jgi:hypothetical protein
MFRLRSKCPGYATASTMRIAPSIARAPAKPSPTDTMRVIAIAVSSMSGSSQPPDRENAQLPSVGASEGTGWAHKGRVVPIHTVSARYLKAMSTAQAAALLPAFCLINHRSVMQATDGTLAG